MIPPTCSTCGTKGAILWKSSADLYRGTDYGPVWVCRLYPKCQSWVGCNPRTRDPLGTPAGPELRKARNAAHAAFDPLWRAKIAIANREIDAAHGNEKKLAELKRARMAVGGARRAGYVWLGRQIGIPDDEIQAKCHIALFDEPTCRRVVEICSPYVAKLAKRNAR